MFRSIFSAESGMFIGYGIALSAVSSSIAGYYLLINPVATTLGFTGFKFIGLSVLPTLLAAAAALTIQYKEIAPRKFEIFPHLADRAAFKAGKEVMVNPKESPDKPSMLPTYKRLARNGDSIRDRKARRDSTLCYVFEALGALVGIGAMLGSSNPVVQMGAIAWGIYSVWGCEFGLSHAEKSAAECLDASQERDYRVEKARIQENA
jgi:hypothetical protein